MACAFHAMRHACGFVGNVFCGCLFSESFYSIKKVEKEYGRTYGNENEVEVLA